MDDLRDVEKILGYNFKNYTLLEKALESAGVPCHGNNKNEGNKPLAQVGDALIRLITLDDCFQEGKNTGTLSKTLLLKSHSLKKQGKVRRFAKKSFPIVLCKTCSKTVA
jgi:dsRNA-specific ribonuclease